VGRGLTIDPAAAAPIWRQIEEQVRLLVVSGALPPGAAVPSVRELARTLRINPATAAKAYQRLADRGVLEVRRGEGTFVAAAPPEVEAAERRGALRGAAQAFASAAMGLGAGADEAHDALDAAWSRLPADDGADR